MSQISGARGRNILLQGVRLFGKEPHERREEGTAYNSHHQERAPSLVWVPGLSGRAQKIVGNMRDMKTLVSTPHHKPSSGVSTAMRESRIHIGDTNRRP